MSKLEIAVLLAAGGLFVFVLEVVRRRRLSEGYALLWLAVAVTGVLVGLARPVVDRVSTSVGIVYGTSLVFSVAILFLLAVCINLSMHVSKLEHQIEALAQEVAFLRGPRTPEPDPEADPDPDAEAAAATAEADRPNW